MHRLVFSPIQISNVWHPCPRLVKYDIFTCSSLCHLNFPMLPLLPQCESHCVILYYMNELMTRYKSQYVVQFGKQVSVDDKASKMKQQYSNEDLQEAVNKIKNGLLSTRAENGWNFSLKETLTWHIENRRQFKNSEKVNQKLL